MRDDFSKKTIEVLGKRVGYLCSNPLCQKPSIGSHSEKDKATIIGVAAHITAASAGGPRFDPNLSAEQRSDIENGIWLCENCATLIDKDPTAFPVDLVKLWKATSEDRSYRAILEHNYSNLPQVDRKRPYIDAELKMTTKGKFNHGLSRKTNEMYGDTPIMQSQAIWHYKIDWQYKFVIVNNSSVGLHNLKLLSHKHNRGLTILEKLDRINNLPPYQEVALRCESLHFVEGTGRDANVFLQMPYSPHVNELKYLIEYAGEDRTKYYTELVFRNGEMESAHLEGKPGDYA